MRALLFTLIVLILLGFQSCHKEQVIYDAEANRELELPTILRINNKECCYDSFENSLRFPIDHSIINNFSAFIEFQDYSIVFFEGSKLKNNSVNNLGTIEINKEYEVIIKSSDETKKLLLTFTTLPIVQIITPNDVFDEPKTIAKIIVNYRNPNKKSEKHYIGIEYRGGASQAYQKKSFGFSLKMSINLNDDISDSFFEMRDNNDWILDAMWIDNARLRNKTSFELWKKMDGNKPIGISGEFVELYINNEHQGLYCLNENINSEFLNLQNANAVLYKATAWGSGATRFENYSDNSPQNYYWDGWEQKYPDPSVRINWEPLDQLRELVVDKNNNRFSSQISSLIDIDNFVDYYIFLNLILAPDNTGKNTFLLKENTANKFYIIPWDLDGSWGLFWDGSRISYTSVLSNNLFDRLIELDIGDFNNKLKNRWNHLRGNAFIEFELMNMFIKNFNQVNQLDIINLENKKWGCQINIEEEQEYLLDWLEKRVVFLDNYFAQM